MQNIEVKARLLDRAKVEKRLQALGARSLWTRRQLDTFYVTSRNWLKLREAEGRPPELISYSRATGGSGPRASDYDVEILKDVASWRRLLERVLPVEVIVEKERTLWIYQHTRVHLDRVEGLGEFIELETVVDGIGLEDARDEAARVAETLRIDPAEQITVPYKDLLLSRRGK